MKKELILATTNDSVIKQIFNGRMYNENNMVVAPKLYLLDTDLDSSIRLLGVDGTYAKKLIWGTRHLLETNNEYRQILPYYVFTKVIDGVKCIYTYLRTNKIGEARLANKASIGVGGHIEIDDIKYTENGLDLLGIITANAGREIHEEIKFSTEIKSDPDNKACKGFHVASEDLIPTVFLASDEDDVSTHHLMVTSIIDLDNPKYKTIWGDVNIDIAEDELLQIGFVPLTDLQDTEKYNLETWSRLLVTHVL